MSPDPDDRWQGVERFCHSLVGALNDLQHDAMVVSVDDAGIRNADVVITNAQVVVRTRQPRVHVYHGVALPQMLRSHAESSLRWRVKAAVAQSAAQFRAGVGAHRVSVSRSTARELRRVYGFGSTVLANGIDTTAFQPRSETGDRGSGAADRTALFIGRPEWRKRPDIAVHAARALGYRILLAAGRPFDGMEWLGRLSESDLAAAIASADVVLMPTQYEACSLAFLEALAVGTPTVTTTAGWVPDLVAAVPDYALLVAKVGSAESFERALGRALDPPASEAMRHANAFVRQECSLESFGQRWSDFLQRVVRSDGDA
ncbi:glycosyltransferase family 4 protein [Cellulomonas sp. Root485]|uniref:glycosyltransferase family 4 protein n=1 Tax=Cellulomonas sp. Root485 TaxID=1736546 RepID=UPI00138F442B|nr:glycosyltransferase family 4 protein [Cellulomonas sp. Root485]